MAISTWRVSALELPPEHVTFFESKIRPVLAESCYECHNSVNKTKAGLALDYRDALLAGSDAGEVVVPGKPEDSALIWAIRHEDDLEMPENGPKLDDSVIRDFEEWVKMGAPDPRDKKPTQLDLDNAVPWPALLEKRSKWWSFQPPKKSPFPRVSNEEWSENPIDRYIYSALMEKGLQPQGLAAPEVLARRAHLILTGLPPKAEVVEKFVSDPSEEAYRAMIDRLLASKAYGERWGRHWMDWYRFAETHGSEGDPEIPYAGIYRDYIIRALNQDVPYNQLLREHIAGDLMKRPRINEELELNESAIGPAHFRMVPHGFGVTDAYQEQITYTENQIDVISKAMLGITVSCARCHNHKFDPISQKDFYRFYGIMISNRPGTRNVDAAEKQATNKRELLKLKLKIRKGMSDYWLKHTDAAVEKLAAFSFPETEEEKALFEDPEKDPDERKLEIPTDPNLLNQLWRKQEMNAVGEYHPFYPIKEWLDKPAAEIRAAWNQQIANHAKESEAYESAKKKATFYADLREQKTLDAWYQEGNGLGPKVSPAGSFAVSGEGFSAISGIYPRGVYSHLISDKHNGTLASPNHTSNGEKSYMRAAGFDGAIRMSARHYPLEQGLHPYETAGTGFMQWFPLAKYKFWNEEQVHYQISTVGDKPTKSKEGRSWFGVTEVIGGDIEVKEMGAPLFTVIENAEGVTDWVSLLAAYKKALEESIVAWRKSRISDAQAEFLSAFVRFNLLPNFYETLPGQLAPLFAEYRALENAIPFPTRAPAIFEGDVVDQPLLVRGEYKKEADIVARQFLEVFSDKAYSKRNSGRLELAADIVGEVNTLKSRVLVNRLWNYVFGRGIVPTTDNFGRLGKKPAHPELLDFLALEFEKQGWSIKTALRQMVLSRTFRSSSSAPIDIKDRDPDNEYLSHYTPRRLDAEAIMDSVNSMARDDFERGVYVETARNDLNPFLSTFNLPIPTTTVSNRDSTNVPAQALSMMNGEFVHETAELWAKKIEGKHAVGSIQAKIHSLYMDAYARAPTDEEKGRFIEYYSSIDSSDTVLKSIAFVLLNSKEFIYVY